MIRPTSVSSWLNEPFVSTASAIIIALVTIGSYFILLKTETTKWVLLFITLSLLAGLAESLHGQDRRLLALSSLILLTYLLLYLVAVTTLPLLITLILYLLALYTLFKSTLSRWLDNRDYPPLFFSLIGGFLICSTLPFGLFNLTLLILLPVLVYLPLFITDSLKSRLDVAKVVIISMIGAGLITATAVMFV